ncbi:unnamed protein product [Gongylonema pulchrum]|uniref:GED domain-containing protein n=1 Tax=Gongylonema pulchrum TaxID=637853 RepID=A0A183D4T5_9BILA|nr:unnamed protein product [Gongylonema pulchrum]
MFQAFHYCICQIMCCPEFKLSMALGKRSSNEADEDDDEPPSNVRDEMKKLVTQVFRKYIIEAILPHVLRLKYYLQEKRLPELEFGIIRVLRELCKDHREQLDEFLASDKQLKAEIKFDLEKLEIIGIFENLFLANVPAESTPPTASNAPDAVAVETDDKNSSKTAQEEMEVDSDKNENDEEMPEEPCPAQVSWM